MKLPYLYIVHSSHISQLDVDLNMSISNLSVSSGATLRMDMLLYDIAVLYNEKGNVNVLNSYQLSRAYLHNCNSNVSDCNTACFTGYSYYSGNSSCVKNTSYIYPYSQYVLPFDYYYY